MKVEAQRKELATQLEQERTAWSEVLEENEVLRLQHQKRNEKIRQAIQSKPHIKQSADEPIAPILSEGLELLRSDDK